MYVVDCELRLLAYVRVRCELISVVVVAISASYLEGSSRVRTWPADVSTIPPPPPSSVHAHACVRVYVRTHGHGRLGHTLVCSAVLQTQRWLIIRSKRLYKFSKKKKEEEEEAIHMHMKREIKGPRQILLLSLCSAAEFPNLSFSNG